MPQITLTPESANIDFADMQAAAAAVMAGSTIVSGDDIIKAVADIPQKYQRIVVDTKYRCPTADGLKTMLAHIQTNHLKYVPEFYDCDDFSRTFQAFANVFFGNNAVGVVINYGEKHAYSLCFSHTAGAVAYQVVEPQADTAVITTKDPYKWSTAGLILI